MKATLLEGINSEMHHKIHVPGFVKLITLPLGSTAALYLQDHK